MYPKPSIELTDHPDPPTNWGAAEQCVERGTGCGGLVNGMCYNNNVLNRRLICRRYAWDASSGPRHCADIKAMNLSRYALMPHDTVGHWGRADMRVTVVS